MCELTPQTVKRYIKKPPDSLTFPNGSDAAQQTWACHLLRHTFPTYNEKLQNAVSLCDVSKCLWVLGNKGVFQELFWDWDQGYFKPCLDTLLAAPSNNKMSSILLHFMVTECGFSAVPEIVFYGGTGDAFIPIVQGGMVFKDGLSAVHGEYSHTLQWCMIGWAVRRGKIALSRPLVDIYKSLVDTRNPSKTELAQEFGIKKPALFWDLVCDCFAPEKGEYENCTTNVFSESFRAPAYLTREMLSGSLQGAACSDLLKGRHERKNLFINAQGNDGTKDMQDYSKALAGTRGKTTDDVGQIGYNPNFVHVTRATKKKVTTTSITPDADLDANLAAVGNHVNHAQWANWGGILTQAR